MGKKKEIDINSNFIALKFLYGIVDADGTANKEEVMQTLCTKFAVPYRDDNTVYNDLNSAITNFILANDWHSEIKEVWWQTDIEGEVSIEYSAHVYKYVAGNGDEYQKRFYEYGKLIVNGKELEDCPWDITKMEHYKDEMSVLFSKDNSHIDNKFDAVFDRAWTRFEKGRKSDTREEMINACLLIHGGVESYFSPEYYHALDTYSKFISQKWYVYLWECHENDTPEEFTLSLKSFIQRHKEDWAKCKENKVISNKIYTQEHELLRQNFVSEPNDFIFALWGLVQK